MLTKIKIATTVLLVGVVVLCGGGLAYRTRAAGDQAKVGHGAKDQPAGDDHRESSRTLERIQRSAQERRVESEQRDWEHMERLQDVHFRRQEALQEAHFRRQENLQEHFNQEIVATLKLILHELKGAKSR